MNWDRVSGNWRVMRGKVRERWGKLTDDDLDVIDGQYEQLVGRIEHRYGMRRDEIENDVAEWYEMVHHHV